MHRAKNDSGDCVMMDREIEALLAGELSRSGLKSLEKTLRADPAMQEEFYDQLSLDQALGFVLGDGVKGHETAKSILAVLESGSEAKIEKQVMEVLQKKKSSGKRSRGVKSIKIDKKTLKAFKSKKNSPKHGQAPKLMWRITLAAAASIAIVFGGIWGIQRYRSSILGIASFEKTTDGVLVLRQDRKLRAVKNMVVRNGDVIKTLPGARGIMRYRDGSILTLKENSSLALSGTGRAKQVELSHGGIEADVVKQPFNTPMFFVTRHAEIQILGTKIDLNSAKGRTDVETITGRVLVRNRKSAVEEIIYGGQTAEVFKDAEGIRVDDCKKDPSLIVWWRLDELEGSRAMDSSGNGFHGDIEFAEWKAVERGGCLDFSKKNGQVAINLRNHRESIQAGTLACLFKLSATERKPSGGNICRLGLAGAWGLRVWETERGLISLRVGGEVKDKDKRFTQVLTMKNPVITSNSQWHHLAVTYEGMRASLYVDGYLVGQILVKESFPELESICLGQQPRQGKALDAFYRLFGGRLDEVQLYSRALDAAKIKKLAEKSQI
ncbi:LamG-like jellyroll fold domain-containing protein [Verrucomicrobiota bacterium]